MQYDGYNSAFETTCCFSGHIVYSETGVIDTCLSPNELGIYTKQNSRGMMMYPAGENITAVSLFGTDEFKRALPLALTEARSKNIETAQLTDWLMEPKKTELPLMQSAMQMLVISCKPSENFMERVQGIPWYGKSVALITDLNFNKVPNTAGQGFRIINSVKKTVAYTV